ncbi:hypothetical protein [Actinomyces sp. ZJ308]|uniref:hypothetical protein n=1 Tax=Actinomyces sp. ZJ308 TaxID=2708342 RepID=UPI00141EEB7C|nr:hypothetical protein [Actinomyces sp. ZJ308]
MTSEHKAGIAYFARFGTGAVLYSVGVLLGMPWARSLGDSPWRFLVALLPMAGVGVCAWAMMKLAHEADEMQARKVMEALVISAAGTVTTSIAYSFMEEVGAPRVDIEWVGGVWALFFGVGMLWSSWRYR